MADTDYPGSRDPWDIPVSGPESRLAGVDIGYDPKTQMVTMSDGSRMTREQYELRARGQGPAPLPRNFQTGGRRAGRANDRLMHTLERFQHAHQGVPTVDKDHLVYLLKQVDGLVIVAWVSKHRFTYAAVLAGNDWYITGKGDWYGKNQFTNEEFINDVVTHDEVTAIRLVTETELLWQR